MAIVVVAFKDRDIFARLPEIEGIIAMGAEIRRSGTMLGMER